MTSPDLLTKVTDIIRFEFEDSGIPLTEDTRLEDLGFDSLAVVELAIATEDEFGIELNDDEIESLKTIGDVVAFVEAKRKDA